MGIWTLRYIARKPQWKIRFQIAKELGISIYDKPLAEWDIDKIHFLSWLTFYDRLYNLPEGSPPQEVIDNDAKLDRWLEEYKLKKRADEASEHNTRARRGRKTSASGHKNVIKFNVRDDE